MQARNLANAGGKSPEKSMCCRLPRPNGCSAPRVEQKGHHGLFVLQRPCPFQFAAGLRLNTVARHHKQQTVASAKRLYDLLIPICGWAEVALIQPDCMWRKATL